MSNLNNREIHNRETHPEAYRDANGNQIDRDGNGTEVYRDANGNVHTNDAVGTPKTVGQQVPVTTGQRLNPTASNPTPYRDGYVQGRISEHHLQEENLRVRDNDNAARGLMVGIILMSLAGLVTGLLFFLAQRNETPAPASPIIAPSSAPANQSPSRETTIIERNNTQVVPVPQQSAPAPNVNIQVPDASQTAPAQTAPTQTSPTQAAPAQPSTQNSNGAAQNGNVVPAAPQPSTGTTPNGTTGTTTDGTSSGNTGN